MTHPDIVSVIAKNGQYLIGRIISREKSDKIFGYNSNCPKCGCPCMIKEIIDGKCQDCNTISVPEIPK